MHVFPTCLHPWTSFELDDGGDHLGPVRPCCWFKHDVGDMTVETAQEIWNGSGYVNLRAQMLAGTLPEGCPAQCPILAQGSLERRVYIGQLGRRPTRNQLTNLIEIVRRRTVLRSMPINVKATPTLACNLNCVMCYQQHDARIVLSDRAMEELLGILANARLLRVQGGELFASNAGLRFLGRLANDYPNVPIGLITNGTFPIAAGWNVFERLNLAWVIISLDASGAKTYRRIRMGGDWAQTWANVLRVCGLTQRHGDVRPGRRFPVYLSLTPMLNNYQELPTLLALARQAGADVVVNPLTESEATFHLDPFSHAELRPDLLDTLAIAQAYAASHRMPMARATIASFQALVHSVWGSEEV